MPYTFACVLDFEGVCNAQYQNFNIIEFPGVLLRVIEEQAPPKKRSVEIVSTFQRYVKPVQYGSLPKECTDITGITNETIIRQGVSFEKAYSEYYEWLTTHLSATSNGNIRIEPTRDNVLFITCGDWDLGKMLPLQCQLQFPPIKPNKTVLHDCYKQWCNMKDVFMTFYKTPASGMAECLKKLKLPLVGKHHSGIDDCKNIAAIVKRMVEDGCSFAVTGKLNDELKHDNKFNNNNSHNKKKASGKKNQVPVQVPAANNGDSNNFECGYNPRTLPLHQAFVISTASVAIVAESSSSSSTITANNNSTQQQQQEQTKIQESSSAVVNNNNKQQPVKPQANRKPAAAASIRKPAVGAAIAVCKFYNTQQGCKFGAACKFKHQSATQ